MRGKISIAPMLALTDRHWRYFHRIFCKNTMLYTEMIAVGAILYGDTEAFLKTNSIEHPIALQLGGADPEQLARCAKIAVGYGFDEINLNVGCPSGRVQAGNFGAKLLLQPDLVVDAVAAMCKVINIPVSVKTRLGVVGNAAVTDLAKFIDCIANVGCNKLIIHAREVNFSLNPKENRDLPLYYDRVYQIKQMFPELKIIINGDIGTYDDIFTHLQYVDGVMIGREAYYNPYAFAKIDQLFYEDDTAVLTREEVLAKFISYIKDEVNHGVKLSQITRHVLGLYRGISGAKTWRRQVSEHPESLLD